MHLKDSPESHALSRIRWQFFCTFTFDSKQLRKVAGSVQRKICFATLREIARFGGVHFGKLLWLVRLEAGEISANLHHHALVAGLPPHCASEWCCLNMMNIAENRGYGISRVRLYDPTLDGVAYCMKGVRESVHRYGGNHYELSKFGTAEHVTCSKSLLRVIQQYGVDRSVIPSRRTVAKTGPDREESSKTRGHAEVLSEAPGRREVLPIQAPRKPELTKGVPAGTSSVFRSTGGGLYYNTL